MPMDFTSFEEALQICMQAENGSREQQAALEYCLQHAPVDLRQMLVKRLGLQADEKHHEHGCGCGCGKEGQGSH